MTNNAWRYKMKAGFTLIELMIVVAIVGILAAVIIKSYDKGRQNTRDYQTFCRGGYLFDNSSGKQIIGTNGGGVRCR